MKQKFDNLNKVEALFFTFLTLVVVMPIVAPILSAVGLHSISKFIYFVYSFTCHQFASRSLFISDFQYAWCARDTGIWFGFLLAAVLYKKGILKKYKWYWFLIFLIPIGLDGGIQTLSTMPSIDSSGDLGSNVFYVSNNLFRFLTGAWFGIGLSLLLTPNIIASQKLKNLETKKLKKLELFGRFENLKPFVKYLILMCITFVTYFTLIQIWSISSSEVKPTNLLDSKPKIQQTNFFVRRGYGECPTYNENDLLALDCFF